MAEVICRVVYEGITYDLDIDNTIPVRLDVSSVENQRIGAFFGVGSQKFNLPGTPTNNRFFKHAYDVGTEDIPAFYNTIQGFIIYQGETLVDGQFQLQEVITDEDGFVTYACSISDQVVQFKDAIQNKLIANGDWSAYDHVLSKNNIVDSWSDNLLGGSVYYPLCDFGLDDPAKYPSYPRIQLGAGNPGDINSTSTPMRVNQFLPAIKAKDVLNVIFDQVNFRATGSFMASSDFDSMYIMAKSQEALGITGVPGQQNTLQAGLSNSYPVGTVSQVNTSTEEFLKCNIEISDPQDNYNTVDWTYTCPVDGEYTFNAQIGFYNPVLYNGMRNLQVKIAIQWYLNGIYTSEDYALIGEYSGVGPLYIAGAFAGNFSASDDIYAKVKMSYNVGTGVSDNLYIQPGGTSFNCTKAPITFEGSDVDMSLQWDSQTKSIDVLNGLIEQFNLVLTPVYGEKYAINIDTFDQWMAQGRNLDWTDKYQQAKRISINHTVDEQPNELKLQNDTDADRFSVLSQESAPNFQYGTLRLLTDNNISQGTRTIGKFFSPVVIGDQITSGSVDDEGNPTYNLNLGSNFAFPHLYKFDNNNQKSYKFKPRIGYKATATIPGGDSIYIGLPSSYNTVTGSYATISNTSTLPPTGTTRDLHFNNTYTSLAPGLMNSNGISNYTTYWKTYLDSLYWDGARKITMDVEFTQEEYKDIRLNDKIFIKTQQYRINKITGYNLSRRDIATVELLRLYPAYYTAPGEAVDCAFTVSGSYSSSGCSPTPPTPTPSTPTPTTPTAPTPTTPTPVTPGAPTPTVTPSPSPSVTPSPTPAVTPSPGVNCATWEIFCPSTATQGCSFIWEQCGGGECNFTLPPDNNGVICVQVGYTPYAVSSGVVYYLGEYCTDTSCNVD